VKKKEYGLEKVNLNELRRIGEYLYLKASVGMKELG